VRVLPNLGTAVVRKPFASKLIDSFAQAIYPVKSGNSSDAVSDGLAPRLAKLDDLIIKPRAFRRSIRVFGYVAAAIDACLAPSERLVADLSISSLDYLFLLAAFS